MELGAPSIERFLLDGWDCERDEVGCPIWVPGSPRAGQRVLVFAARVVSQKFVEEARDGNAGPSTPLKYASLRMAAALGVSG